MDTDAHEPTPDLTGKEAVRVHFVQRLATSGLKPAGKITEAQQTEVLKRLVDFLAYLSVPSLITLADQTLQAAGGKGRDLWPSELLIRQMAEALERRPFEVKPIVTNWLVSVEGPRAEAGGYLVQLFRHLRQHPRPVGVYDLVQIRKQAEDDRRREGLIRERQVAGWADAEDQRWLVEMLDDTRRAREIVARGQAARDRKAAEGTAA